jgi:cystathionine gamma-synthase
VCAVIAHRAAAAAAAGSTGSALICFVPSLSFTSRPSQALEGAEDSIAFASGMAAISSTLFALLKPGDRVVSIKDSYGGTSLLFLKYLPRFGVEVDLVETSDFAAIEASVQRAHTTLLYLETPTNPTLKVVDIARLAKHAKETWGSIVCVDNTFATPVNQQPLSLGADIVLHSASKYLGGHADALGGIACGNTELVRTVYQWREIHGACLDPHAAYLLLRGLKVGVMQCVVVVCLAYISGGISSISLTSVVARNRPCSCGCRDRTRPRWR